jgi:antitoxin component YwqK of YwqJK toxin-antitoxin module
MSRSIDYLTFVKKTSDTKCSICLEDFPDEQILTECGHLLCDICLIQLKDFKDVTAENFIISTIECPVCRKDLTYRTFNRDDSIEIVHEMSEEYYGNLKSVTYYINGFIHSQEDASNIEYYEDGVTVKQEAFYKNGLLHRDIGPAVIKYDEDGAIVNTLWFYKNGLLHRENDPAVIEYDHGVLKKESYFINDLRHRENGAAVVTYENESVILEEYYQDDLRHRDGNPAVIEYDENGNIQAREYYIEGHFVL